jgi:hypothetical protein
MSAPWSAPSPLNEHAPTHAVAPDATYRPWAKGDHERRKRRCRRDLSRHHPYPRRGPGTAWSDGPSAPSVQRFPEQDVITPSTVN